VLLVIRSGLNVPRRASFVRRRRQRGVERSTVGPERLPSLLDALRRRHSNETLFQPHEPPQSPPRRAITTTEAPESRDGEATPGTLSYTLQFAVPARTSGESGLSPAGLCREQPVEHIAVHKPRVRRWLDIPHRASLRAAHNRPTDTPTPIGEAVAPRHVGHVVQLGRGVTTLVAARSHRRLRNRVRRDLGREVNRQSMAIPLGQRGLVLSSHLGAN